MKKILLTCLLATTHLLCHSQQLSSADLLTDLEYFRTTLPQKHTNLFAKTSQATFDNKINVVKSKINTLNEETFAAELFKLTVAIGDEHTRIEPPYTKALPIKFEMFDEGIFVTGIDPANSNLLLSKLTAINGHPMDKILSSFKEVIQSYNKSYFDVGLLHFLNNPAFLKGLNILDSNDSAEFSLLDKNGKEVKVVLKSRPIGQKSELTLAQPYSTLIAHKSNRKYSYEYDPKASILYFSYTDCQEDKQLPFATFNDALFAEIAKNKPQRIIVDLRYNSGGNSGVLEPFIEKIRNSYLNEKGKIYVLIGKETFSSALMNAVQLKRTTLAVLVGEPTSGNINAYGETRGFWLPKTKILVGYSTRYWENWKGKKGPLVPDVKLKYSIKNFEAGKDEAMEYAYKR